MSVQFDGPLVELLCEELLAPPLPDQAEAVLRCSLPSSGSSHQLLPNSILRVEDGVLGAHQILMYGSCSTHPDPPCQPPRIHDSRLGLQPWSRSLCTSLEWHQSMAGIT